MMSDIAALTRIRRTNSHGVEADPDPDPDPVEPSPVVPDHELVERYLPAADAEYVLLGVNDEWWESTGAAQLADARREIPFSQQQLGSRIGASQSLVASYETARSTPPTDRLEALEEALYDAGVAAPLFTDRRYDLRVEGVLPDG